MRNDDRRRASDEEEDLFRDLRSEMEALQEQPAGAAGAAPPSPAPQPDAASPAPGAGLAQAAYPPAGFDSDEDLDKLPSMTPGHAPRSAPRRASPSRPPRVILGALFVVLAAAVLMFWPRGRSEPPLGVGERRLTVTADGAFETASPAQTTPVDIGSQTRNVVPEQAAGRTQAAATSSAPLAAPRQNPPATASRPQTTPAPIPAEVKAEPAPAQTETPAPPAPQAQGPQPQAQGSWLLQLGAFSTQENAQSLIAKLHREGLQPLMQTGGSADGKLWYKVSLGYFQTREDAAEFARRHARVVGGDSRPVHR